MIITEALRAMLQFTTILPMGRHADYDAFARHAYLMPLSGYLVGGIAGLFAMLFAEPRIAGAVALAVALVLTGLNHFDGLCDLGDGMMAHGSREKRVTALTDRTLGAGAVGAALVVTLLAYAGITSVAWIAGAILIAEVMGKFAQVLLIVIGHSFHDGMFSYIHGFACWWFIPLSGLFLCPLLLLPVGLFSVGGAMASTLLTVGILLVVTRQLFGGVNGDIVGASHELTRCMVLLSLAVTGF
ncbi:adenosylcobinamide-GDP ribazoletransferase [Methanogenium organophilum]|uniref:Adenosylcobinamide-GDP ribazoletransferase n=1 Tax=Methanogenium organophilum TaxID=2199 RepID=A0A9X9T723_METOG|nr:adenosylcobinamide-GDP ribazoletransferase [Methanogenium organophilum]WAI00579.1 adenosylcobinamide-GDP ribazoletransferase [Methanogenium organophilum]